MPESFLVQAEKQAALLLDEEVLQVLDCILHEAKGPAAIARETSRSIGWIYHRLGKLLAAGLVFVESEQLRGGRPIKLYRAVSQRYLVPINLTRSAEIGELVSQLLSPSHRLLVDRASRTITNDARKTRLLIAPDDLGKLNTIISPGDDRPSGPDVLWYYEYQQYDLTPESITELEDKLTELTEWLTARTLRDRGIGEAQSIAVTLGAVSVSKVAG